MSESASRLGVSGQSPRSKDAHMCFAHRASNVAARRLPRKEVMRLDPTPSPRVTTTSAGSFHSTVGIPSGMSTLSLQYIVYVLTSDFPTAMPCTVWICRLEGAKSMALTSTLKEPTWSVAILRLPTHRRQLSICIPSYRVVALSETCTFRTEPGVAQ